MKYKHASRAIAGLAVLFLLFLFVSLEVHAKIVFAAKRKHQGDTLYHIYVMEDDGSNVQRITSSLHYDVNPCWFPDGKQIVFERDHSKGAGLLRLANAEFLIIDATSTNARRFMINHNTDRYPVVSPDGKQIAFNSNRSGHHDIYTVNLEAGQVKRLTDNHREFGGGFSHQLDWSPDGKQIAYQHVEGVDEDIWIMDADGKRKEQFSPPPAGPSVLRSAPAWSPSGGYIMYRQFELTPDFKNPVASQIIIQNVFSGRQDIHDLPKVTLIGGVCWMGNDHTVLLSMRDDGAAPNSVYNIYRYDLNSRKRTNLTQLPEGHAYDPHWIAGSLAVIPVGKLTIRWAELKQTN